MCRSTSTCIAGSAAAPISPASSDVRYGEGLLAVRAEFKRGKERFVPTTSELAKEIRRYSTVIRQDRIFPPKGGAAGKRQIWTMMEKRKPVQEEGDRANIA